MDKRSALSHSPRTGHPRPDECGGTAHHRIEKGDEDEKRSAKQGVGVGQPHSGRRFSLRCLHIFWAAFGGLGRWHRRHTDSVLLCRGALSIPSLDRMVQSDVGVLGSGRAVPARIRIAADSDVDTCAARTLRRDSRRHATSSRS